MSDSSKYFQNLPDEALLWIHTTDAPIDEAARAEVLKVVRAFISSWTSHQRPVVAETQFLHDKFLLVCAHIPGGDVSGCGIDKLMHQLEDIQSDRPWSWIDSLRVVYRTETNAIADISRGEFRDLVTSGEISAETVVFDTSLHSLSDLRSGGFERRAKNSWHGQVFNLGVEIGA